MKEQYNWWTDPKNKEEVERISWWNKSENKTTIELPVSIVTDGEYWCVCANEETEKLIGNGITSASQGKTKQEAIKHFFESMKFMHDFIENDRMRFERWVPLIVGPWRHIGGRWFTVFGLHFSFRYGKGMHGGFYLPMTRLNISFHSLWSRYKKYKQTKT